MRKRQYTKTSKEERSHFCAKEAAQVTASRKGKKKAKPGPLLQVKIPVKNQYKSRQSFGKVLNRCRTELPHSPQKQVAVVSGFTKQVGLSIQNDYKKQCHGNPSLTDTLKAF